MLLLLFIQKAGALTLARSLFLMTNSYCFSTGAVHNTSLTNHARNNGRMRVCFLFLSKGVVLRILSKTLVVWMCIRALSLHHIFLWAVHDNQLLMQHHLCLIDFSQHQICDSMKIRLRWIVYCTCCVHLLIVQPRSHINYTLF